ncbi:YcdB/YcdC domain-containing protein [Brevibacillus agri]|uniref:YcdB/YcdC domain-containing protein n=1 Tax=Brevibacillus agri TaxID=51101 RepID=UPI002867D947|nr:YcdB/YcdC domain-containing protein [Brevibacillus agri]
MKRINQSVMTAVAACLLAATPIWTMPPQAEAAGSAQEQLPQQKEFSQEVQNTLDKLKEAIPEIKALRLERKSVGKPSFRNYPHQVWTVLLTDRPETGAEKSRLAYATARIELDAQTGRLLYLDVKNPAWASADYPDEKLAREKADAFLASILGKDASQFKQSKALSRGKAGIGDGKGDGKGAMIEWVYSTVYYQTLINQIALDGNALSVSVDHAGHVIRFDAYNQIRPDEVKWPDPQKAISLEKAKQIYQDKLKMELEYVAEQPTSYSAPGRAEEKKPMLVYQPYGVYRIDALTGEVLDEPDQQAKESVQVKGEGKTIKIASQKEAEQWLKSQFGIDVAGATFEYDDHKDNLREGLQAIESYHWMDFTEKANQAFETITLTTDAASDRLIDFHLYLPERQEQKQKISVDEARKKAIAALQPYLDPAVSELTLFTFRHDEAIPDWVDKSKLEKRNEPREYYFNFQGKRNGIPVSDEFYRVGIDQVTGAVTGLSFHPIHPDIALPAATKLVSAQEAKETYQKEVELELVYYWEQYEDQRAPEPKLVYQRKREDSYRFVDATTGKLIEIKYR